MADANLVQGIATKALDSSFFGRPALEVAAGLLGKFLVRRMGRRKVALMITEVEAYDGFEDRASHASRGETPRNRTMFGPAGRWYIYFTYGMHWMLNIVTGPKGYPAAILIRGVEGINGPARLTKALGVDGRLNGKTASRASGLWIEDRGVRVSRPHMTRKPRVGVDYAGEWAKKPYRFMICRSKTASTPAASWRKN